MSPYGIWPIYLLKVEPLVHFNRLSSKIPVKLVIETDAKKSVSVKLEFSVFRLFLELFDFLPLFIMLHKSLWLKSSVYSFYYNADSLDCKLSVGHYSKFESISLVFDIFIL